MEDESRGAPLSPSQDEEVIITIDSLPPHREPSSLLLPVQPEEEPEVIPDFSPPPQPGDEPSGRNDGDEVDGEKKNSSSSTSSSADLSFDGSPDDNDELQCGNERFFDLLGPNLSRRVILRVSDKKAGSILGLPSCSSLTASTKVGLCIFLPKSYKCFVATREKYLPVINNLIDTNFLEL